MILCLDKLDYDQVQHACRHYPRSSYGLALPFEPAAVYSHILSQGENLFLTAHGNDVGVGHPDGSPRFCAATLAEFLQQQVLPWGFGADIYLCAPGARPAFLDLLLTRLGADYRGRLRGAFNLAYGQIPPPDRHHWVIAA